MENTGVRRGLPAFLFCLYLTFRNWAGSGLSVCGLCWVQMPASLVKFALVFDFSFSGDIDSQKTS